MVAVFLFMLISLLVDCLLVGVFIFLSLLLTPMNSNFRRTCLVAENCRLAFDFYSPLPLFFRLFPCLFVLFFHIEISFVPSPGWSLCPGIPLVVVISILFMYENWMELRGMGAESGWRLLSMEKVYRRWAGEAWERFDFFIIFYFFLLFFFSFSISLFELK